MLEKILKFTAAAIIINRIIGYAGKKLHITTPSAMGFILDNPVRKMLLPPRTLVARSGVKPRMRLLELGAGSGAFTPAFARAVGRGGTVYAVDMQQGMLDQIERKLARPRYQDIHNVEIVRANAYNLPFSDNYFDMVCTVGVLPEIPDLDRALSEIRRVLKPGGILADTEQIPDPHYPLKSAMKKAILKSGMHYEGSAGKFISYTLRFSKE